MELHHSLLIDDRRAELYLPAGECRRILYLHGDIDQTASCAELLRETDAALVLLPDVNWNAELTPWPAPKVFRDGDDFGGRAPAYLRLLTETILPQVEAHLPAAPLHRGIGGYSLGGLFAVYAFWESPLFDHAVSMSGSLWYDDFLEYALRKAPAGRKERVYLSIGDREKKTRNLRMARGEERTRLLQTELERLGIPAELVLHPGGHFNDIAWRIRQGVSHFGNGVSG